MTIFGSKFGHFEGSYPTKNQKNRKKFISEKTCSATLNWCKNGLVELTHFHALSLRRRGGWPAGWRGGFVAGLSGGGVQSGSPWRGPGAAAAPGGV